MYFKGVSIEGVTGISRAGLKFRFHGVGGWIVQRSLLASGGALGKNRTMDNKKKILVIDNDTEVIDVSNEHNQRYF